MARYGVRPSRQHALLIAVLGTDGPRLFSVATDDHRDGGPERDAPPGFRVRPSRKMAVAGAVFGVALLVIGVVRFLDGPGSKGFPVLWVAFGLVIIAFNLWSAFARSSGGTYRLDRED